ncbi:hypothetical protein TWF718_008641 [Orbilia javanica]|uniref:Uncharacterized protein n=1 Tax=Orbilia javanica TaxID=47235 RepID=A0AAN8MY92_9PEZI
MTTALGLILILVSLPYSRAFEWDDFTNNLATDLAPLITLFGEQVTKQFLSESLSIWDNIIFAMAPLGILTAVVSAIRVCGNASLRAFIGRAQESPGTAEVELTSCTSETTSELWHEEGIARVFGAPQILQVVKVKSDDMFYEDTDKTAGIFLFSDACGPGELPTDEIADVDPKLAGTSSPRPRPIRPWRLVKGTEHDSEKAHQHHPNLSLNIGIKRQPKKFTYAAAVFGIILQIGVMVYAGIITYKFPDEFKKGEDSVGSHAFPLTFAGTVLLCLGMFLCAYIVEQTTHEVYYEQKQPEQDVAEMYWVQPGGQKIGDQVFGSFIGFSDDYRYIKSSRAGSRNRFDGVLWITVIVTIFGFFIQFIGLREAHSSVIMAQLGATLLMSVIRAGLRSQRMTKETDILKREGQNDYRNLLQGHELDFLATKLEDVETLFVNPKQDGASPGQSGISNGHVPGTPAPTPQTTGNAVRALKARARLARLTSEEEYGLNWKDIQVRDIALQLQTVIEGVMETFSTKLKDQNVRDYSWPIDISSTLKPSVGTVTPIGHRPANKTTAEIFPLRLRKEGIAWKIDFSDLEALLGIWAWSLLRYKADGNSNYRLDKRNIRLIAVAPGSSLDETKTWYHVWIQRRSVLEELGNIDRSKPVWTIQNRPLFGCQVSREAGPATQPLYVTTQNTTLSMCAHDIFISFLGNLLQNIDEIGGKTDTRTPFDSQNAFLLRNSQIEEVANLFENSGLGSREDAYMCTIPMLVRDAKLPGIKEVLSAAQDQVSTYKNDGKWKDAELLLQWMCYSSDVVAVETETVYLMLGEFYRMAMRHEEQDIRLVGFEGLCKMVERASQLPDQDSDIAKLVRQYGWIGLQIAAEIQDDVQKDALKQSGVKEDLVPDYTDASQLWEWGKKGDMTVARYLIGRKDYDVDEEKDNDGRTALSWAAQNGNIEIATLLLENNANRNLGDSNQKTPLSYAAENGCDSIVDLLLKGDTTSINTSTNDYGRTPLMLAARNGHETVVEILLGTLHVNIDVRDVEGRTAMAHAVSEGHQRILELLIDAGADVNAVDNDAETTLRMAVLGSHLNIADFLVKNGADVNAINNAGEAAIHIAVEKGYQETIDLLIKNGANVNVKSKAGSVALQVAAANGYREIVGLLLRSRADVNAKGPEGVTALQKAAEKGYQEIVDLLIRNKADVNTKDREGVTALQAAAENGYGEIVNLLIQNGGDVTAINWMSTTALHHAAEKGHKGIVDMLLHHGANVNNREKGGRTALQKAAFNGHREIVETLIEHGADVNLGFRPPIKAAAKAGHLELVKILINKGADVNACSQTVLKVAAKGGYLEIAKLLLENGADIQANKGIALLRAIKKGHREMIKFLIDNGADVNADDGSPVHLAAREGDIELLQLLLDHGATPDTSEGAALRDSVWRGHLKVVKLLLDNGADINTYNGGPLQDSIKRGHRDITNLLLSYHNADANVEDTAAPKGVVMQEENGAAKPLVSRKLNVNLRNPGGETALLIASMQGEEDLVELLIGKDFNADVNIGDRFGKTALDRAREKGHTKIVKLLQQNGAMPGKPPNTPPSLLFDD